MNWHKPLALALVCLFGAAIFITLGGMKVIGYTDVISAEKEV